MPARALERLTKEREGLREAYWRRCDPFWCDGPGCKSLAGSFRPQIRLCCHQHLSAEASAEEKQKALAAAAILQGRIPSAPFQ